MNAIDEIVARNVENFRWALRQTVEDAVRQFAARLDTELAQTLQLVDEAAETARALRSQASSRVEEELLTRRSRASRLEEIADRIAAGSGLIEVASSSPSGALGSV